MEIYTVKQGDTLTGIARKYGVPPERIISDNELQNPARLVTGQTLLILFPTRTHTVSPGETLYSISGRYGVPVMQLWQNNPILAGKDTIYTGQVLNISYNQPRLGEVSSNGYAYTFADRDTLRRTLPFLTFLSVFSYGIKTDGTLLLPGNDEDIISLAKSYNTAPLLVLSSITEGGTFSSANVELLLSDPALQEKIIGSILYVVRLKGFSGVDVDFEYIPASVSEEYVSFISKLKEALEREGYFLFIALAPKTSAAQSGLLYEGIIYSELGAIADSSLIMTYEWGYTYGPPMAVAPLPNVRRVAEYAASEIPPQKLLLGVPNYGYDWPLPYVRGETKAETVSNNAAVERALRFGAEISFDSTAKAPFYYYTDGGKEHVVWFENAESINAKYELLSELGYQGFGVWNIMKWFCQMWSLENQLFTISKAFQTP